MSSANCDLPKCGKLADFEIRGQWTIADWLDISACTEHLVDAVRWLYARRIDGQELQELTWWSYS